MTTRWRKVGVLAGLLLTGAAAARGQDPQAAPPDGIDRHKLSYAIGYQIGSQFAGNGPEVDLSTVEKAIEDAYARRRPAVSMQDMHAQLSQLEERMHAQAMAEFKRLAAENARKSAAYLASNRKRPGVVVLPSGIQYKVLKRGEGGRSPHVDSRVTVNYRGMLVDGTEFDSSWAHGAPVSFVVDQVIPGWQDVIPRMHVGDRWNVVIPAKLAYGERGELPRIGPDEALVFDIELLGIQ